MSDRAPAATGGKAAKRFDWERAFRKSGVGLGPAMAGLALSTYASADGTNIYPSRRALAEGLGVDRKCFNRWIEELTEIGWLEVVAVRPKRQREYRLTIPIGGSEPPVVATLNPSIGGSQPPVNPSIGGSQPPTLGALRPTIGGSQPPTLGALSPLTNTGTRSETRSETNTGTKRGSATPTPDQNIVVSAETVGTKRGSATPTPDQNSVSAEVTEPTMMDPDKFEDVPIRTLMPEICRRLDGAKDQQEIQYLHSKYFEAINGCDDKRAHKAFSGRVNALAARGKWDADEWKQVTS